MGEYRELAGREILRLLQPGPLVLVGTVHRGQENVMPAAWVRPLSGTPTLIGLSIQPSRLTHEFLSKSEQCTLSIPTIDAIDAVHFCGSHSGRDVDKFERTGLELQESSVVEAPTIAGCPAVIEGVLADRIAMGDHDLFVVRVAFAQADDEAFGETWEAGTDAAGLLHHLGGDHFAVLGRHYRASGAAQEQ